MHAAAAMVGRESYETAPEQLVLIGVVLILDVIGLVSINRIKASGAPPPSWSWPVKRNAFWALITLLIGVAVTTDMHFPIGRYHHGIKAYVFAFPVGLLDLWFSSTRGVPLKVLAGASLWCSTMLLRVWLADRWFDRPISPVMIREVSLRSLAVEVVRYLAMLPTVGLLSDLLFSPMHRLAHHPLVYTAHHKEHHTYTNELTSLVLYHGTLLDDFLMPATTVVGGLLWVLLLGAAGLEHEAFSNLGVYLLICNTLMSHAHDVRCARLMAPLPQGLNFVAYHWVHHISPSHNFGLTEPSDMLWDWLLGVSTIKQPGDNVKKKS